MAIPDRTRFCKLVEWVVGTVIFGYLAYFIGWQDFLHALARNPSWGDVAFAAFLFLVGLMGAGIGAAMVALSIPVVIAILAFLFLKYE
jgi:hypothetical protein